MGGVSADGYIVGPDGKPDARVRADLAGAAEGGLLADAGLSRGSEHMLARADLRVSRQPVEEIIMTHTSTATAAVCTQ